MKSVTYFSTTHRDTLDKLVIQSPKESTDSVLIYSPVHIKQTFQSFIPIGKYDQ